MQIQATNEYLQKERYSLLTMLQNSQSTFLTLPKLVLSTDSHLDNAEHEFSEGALNPFWDEVERATNSLNSFHNGIRSIESNSKEYRA